MERSATAAAVALLFTTALLAGLLTVRRLTDFDVLWHVRTGQWILEQGHVPRTDPFGSMTGDVAWLDVAWAAQVVGARIVRWAGLTGLQLVVAALVSGTLLAVSLRSPRTLVVLTASLTFVLAAWQRFLVRPDVLAFPFVVLLLLLVERLAARRPHTILCIGILSAVWANVHGSYILAPLLLLAATAGAWIAVLDAAVVRAHLLAFATSVACCLANPYGYRLFALLEKYFGSLLATLGALPPSERLNIVEWAPTWRILLRDPVFPSIPFLLMVLLLAVSFFGVGGKLALRRLPSACVLLALALAASRNVLPFAAGGLFLIGRNERDRLRGVAVLARGRVARASAHALTRLAVALALVVVALSQIRAVVSDAFYVGLDIPILTGVGPNLELVPEGAVQWLATHEPPGRVFNNYDSGSYLLYRLFPHVRPYVDARMDVFEHGRAIDRAIRDPAAFRALLERDQIGTIVLVHPSPESLRVLPVLAQDPSWALQFRDSNSTIHVRSDRVPVPERPRPLPLAPALEPAAERINAWLGRFKGPVLPSAELTEAFVSGVLGERERQVDAYRRALLRAPENFRAHQMLRELGAAER